MALGSLIPLFDPIPLSLLPVGCWEKSITTLRWGGTGGEGRAGWLWRDVDSVSNPWGMIICAWVKFLIKFSQQVHPGLRVQTARSRDYRSLCFYSSRHTPNALSLMKVSACSCTINNNLNIVCLSSSGWGWSDHFGKMEQLSSKNMYLKNYSGRSETYKLINGLKLRWRLWWEKKFSSRKKTKEKRELFQDFYCLKLRI